MLFPQVTGSTSLELVRYKTDKNVRVEIIEKHILKIEIIIIHKTM